MDSQGRLPGSSMWLKRGFNPTTRGWEDPLRLGPTQAAERGNMEAPKLPKNTQLQQTFPKFPGFFFFSTVYWPHTRHILPLTLSNMPPKPTHFLNLNFNSRPGGDWLPPNTFPEMSNLRVPSYTLFNSAVCWGQCWWRAPRLNMHQT